MPAVKYRFRILADEGFIRWLIQRDKTAFFKLTHIKKSSIDCRGEHNVMIENDGQKIIGEKLIQEHNLRAAFKGKEMPRIISTSILNKYDQMVIFAIILATTKPFFTYILTTKESLQYYTNSSHFNGVKCISVKAEEDALKLIGILW